MRCHRRQILQQFLRSQVSAVVFWKICPTHASIASVSVTPVTSNTCQFIHWLDLWAPGGRSNRCFPGLLFMLYEAFHIPLTCNEINPRPLHHSQLVRLRRYTESEGAYRPHEFLLGRDLLQEFCSVQAERAGTVDLDTSTNSSCRNARGH